MKVKKINHFIVLFFFINTLIAQEQLENNKEEKKAVTYKEQRTYIEGVFKYRLEIYDLSNKPILIKETTDNEVLVELPPGKYKKRLGLINNYNQLFLYTDWKNFEILEIPEPKITFIEKKSIDPSKIEEKIQVSIIGITKDTKIFLKNKNNEQIPINYNQIDTNRIVLKINPKTLKEGNYQLVVKNSEKKITEIPDFINIQKTKSIAKKRPLDWDLLIPGIPQRERKENLKANILQWGFIGSLFSSGYFYNQAKKDQQKYNSLLLTQLGSNYLTFQTTTKFYQSTMGLIFIYNQSKQIETILKSYNYNKNLFYFSLSLGILFYSYHVIDTLYYEIYSNPIKNEVSATITIRF
jgi:phosphate/sulfate permease